MRVIAGILGGRTFKAPAGHRTHPMSDKIRGALFNALGDITGLSVLDAFSGSGGLAIEAISRGARIVTAIEIDKTAHRVITENFQTLGIAAKVIRANISSWSDNNPQSLFDIVLCDPPYDSVNISLLAKLERHVKPGGILVLSLPPKHEVTLPPTLQHLNTKSYGDALLVFYRAAM